MARSIRYQFFFIKKGLSPPCVFYSLSPSSKLFFNPPARTPYMFSIAPISSTPKHLPHTLTSSYLDPAEWSSLKNSRSNLVYSPKPHHHFFTITTSPPHEISNSTKQTFAFLHRSREGVCHKCMSTSCVIRNEMICSMGPGFTAH